jgi:hypothetical protein
MCSVIPIVTVHGTNMDMLCSKIYKTLIRIVMSAVTVTMTRILLVLFVKFQENLHVLSLTDEASELALTHCELHL